MATALLGKTYTAGPGGQILRQTSGNTVAAPLVKAAPTASPAVTPSVATPSISMDPLLQQIQGLISNNSGAAFDPVYGNALNQIQSRLAELTSGQEVSTRRLGEDYKKGQGQLATSQEQTKSQLSNKMANQGLGISGINVGEHGKVDTAYQKANADLDTQYARGGEDITRSAALARQGLSEMLSGAESDRSGRAAEAARVAAENEAKVAAAQEAANSSRVWMDNIMSTLTQSVQPVPTPTGQYQPSEAYNTPIQSFVPSYAAPPSMGAPPPPPMNTPTAPIMGGAPQTGAFQLSKLPSYKQRQLR